MGNMSSEISKVIMRSMDTGSKVTLPEGTRITMPSPKNSLFDEAYFNLTVANAFGMPPILFKSLKDRKSIVVDVNVIVPNKVVEVTFADGSKQKVVCSDDDTFSLEQAISICITKNLIGGTKNYNKAVGDGMKVYQKKIAKQETDKAEVERIKTKKAKTTVKRAERIARKRAKEIEEQIEIQKEAIIRANREMGR